MPGFKNKSILSIKKSAKKHEMSVNAETLLEPLNKQPSTLVSELKKGKGMKKD